MSGTLADGPNSVSGKSARAVKRRFPPRRTSARREDLERLISGMITPRARSAGGGRSRWRSGRTPRGWSCSRISDRSPRHIPRGGSSRTAPESHAGPEPGTEPSEVGPGRLGRTAARRHRQGRPASSGSGRLAPGRGRRPGGSAPGGGVPRRTVAASRGSRRPQQSLRGRRGGRAGAAGPCERRRSWPSAISTSPSDSAASPIQACRADKCGQQDQGGARRGPRMWQHLCLPDRIPVSPKCPASKCAHFSQGRSRATRVPRIRQSGPPPLRSSRQRRLRARTPGRRLLLPPRRCPRPSADSVRISSPRIMTLPQRSGLDAEFPQVRVITLSSTGTSALEPPEQRGLQPRRFPPRSGPADPRASRRSPREPQVVKHRASRRGVQLVEESRHGGLLWFGRGRARRLILPFARCCRSLFSADAAATVAAQDLKHAADVVPLHPSSWHPVRFDDRRDSAGLPDIHRSGKRPSDCDCQASTFSTTGGPKHCVCRAGVARHPSVSGSGGLSDSVGNPVTIKTLLEIAGPKDWCADRGSHVSPERGCLELLLSGQPEEQTLVPLGRVQVVATSAGIDQVHLTQSGFFRTQLGIKLMAAGHYPMGDGRKPRDPCKLGHGIGACGEVVRRADRVGLRGAAQSPVWPTAATVDGSPGVDAFCRGLVARWRANGPPSWCRDSS